MFRRDGKHRICSVRTDQIFNARSSINVLDLIKIGRGISATLPARHQPPRVRPYIVSDGKARAYALGDEQYEARRHQR